MQRRQSRREWLLTATSVVSGAWLAGTSRVHAAAAPTAPVSLARCATYDRAELLAAMQKMFDQIGGLKSLVSGKTVAIKVNLTGAPESLVNGRPVEDTHYAHPHVIAAAVHVIGNAGARRIRVLESPMSTIGSLDEYMARAKWRPPVSGLRRQPLVRRLRRVREPGQDEGARHVGHHAVDEEQLRHPAGVDLRVRCRR